MTKLPPLQRHYDNNNYNLIALKVTISDALPLEAARPVLGLNHEAGRLHGTHNAPA